MEFIGVPGSPRKAVRITPSGFALSDHSVTMPRWRRALRIATYRLRRLRS